MFLTMWTQTDTSQVLPGESAWSTVMHICQSFDSTRKGTRARLFKCALAVAIPDSFYLLQCRPEYKVPGLYVIDSVVRQSRHQFGPEKDVFMPRLCKNILTTFQHIYKCPSEDKVGQTCVARCISFLQRSFIDANGL